MSIRRKGASEAYGLISVGYIALDIRTPEEYAKGHPRGAKNIPYQLAAKGGTYKDNPHFLPLVEAMFPSRGTLLLVVGKVGTRSLAAAEALEKAGYTEVAELRPGILGIVDPATGRLSEDGWITLGLPMEETTDGGSYAEICAKHPEVVAASATNTPSIPAPSQQSAPSQAPPSGFKRLGAVEAYKLSAVGTVFLDIRPPEEYAQGHPVGARNVPFHVYAKGGSFKPNPKFMEVMKATFPCKTSILVIGRIGKRSVLAAEALVAEGYTSVYELRPGVKGLVAPDGSYAENGWEQVGLPMEKQTDGGSYAEICEAAGITP